MFRPQCEAEHSARLQHRFRGSGGGGGWSFAWGQEKIAGGVEEVGPEGAEEVEVVTTGYVLGAQGEA